MQFGGIADIWSDEEAIAEAVPYAHEVHVVGATQLNSKPSQNARNSIAAAFASSFQASARRISLVSRTRTFAEVVVGRMVGIQGLGGKHPEEPNDLALLQIASDDPVEEREGAPVWGYPPSLRRGRGSPPRPARGARP